LQGDLQPAVYYNEFSFIQPVFAGGATLPDDILTRDILSQLSLQ
jgi:hypothetical protein